MGKNNVQKFFLAASCRKVNLLLPTGVHHYSLASVFDPEMNAQCYPQYFPVLKSKAPHV